MAAPLTLPPGATHRYQELFDGLADDNTRRGYLIYLNERNNKLTGANIISRGWNRLTPEARAGYINRPVIAEAPSSGSNNENNNADDPPMNDLPDVAAAPNEDRGQAGPGDSAENAEDQANVVVNAAENQHPDGPTLSEEADDEPSEEEIEQATPGLNAAHTGKPPTPRTRKRSHDEGEGRPSETWRWCMTLFDSHTVRHGPENIRTVVYLYALCDESDTILGLKVCKKVRCESQRYVDHLKEEYVTSQQLELCDHCHHILIAVQEDDTNTFRMYSDYTEHGDLNDLLSIYYQEENLAQQIPEQFIWMIFHALADAIGALSMGECGETLDEERAVEEREEGGKGKGRSKKGMGAKKKPRKPFSGAMVHLDIKPANIFLNTAQAPYGAYPRPILADYDVVKIVSHGTNTAAERRTWGTRGYKAPEIVNEALHHHSVNAKADIWSLGMLVWKMMHTTLGKERSDEICVDSIKASFQFADGNTFTSVDIPGYDAMYSNALHQLVTDCLQINPEKRPGPEYVRRKAKAEFERSQRRLGKVQTDVEDGSDLANHLRLLRGEDSVYKIGAKFQEPPSKKRKTEAPPDEAVEV